MGENGWIFWNDYVDQYASQAVGRKHLTVEEVEQWRSYLASIDSALEAEGIDFTIVLTPSTSSVYPEELPAWMQELRGPTPTDQFVAAAGDLPVIDLRGGLIDRKDSDFHLYSWSNSHWTDYGGAVAWELIADCTNRLYPDSPQLRSPAVTGAEIVGDFNEWASYGVESPGADWAVPQFAEEFQDVTVAAEGTEAIVAGTDPRGATTLPATTTVPESWTGQSALILRDSMGGAIAPFWQQAYSPTRQIGHEWSSFDVFPDYAQLVDEYQPDVVILQLAERHLITVPPPGAGY